MAKQEWEIIYGGLQKKADGVASELLAGGAVNSLFLPIAGPIGRVAGYVAGTDKDELKKINESGMGKNFIPGVGAYRMSQREKAVAKEGERGIANLVGENIGGVTSTLIGGGIGAAIGNKLGGAEGMKLGASAGMGIPMLVAALASLITSRRSKEEQIAHDEKLHAADYVVPGMGLYNQMKRLGSSHNFN